MRLLLAEDERELSNALVTILKHSNYSVDAVYNGADALDYLETGLYDGVILDIMMPRVDGIEVLRRLRAAGNAVPVLLLTAKSEVDDRVLGLDCGADDYLTKPFATRELLARIRAMTRRRTENASPVLTIRNLTLSRSTFELSTEKGSLRLANREYQMIEMMMENPGQVIPVERFMEKIWGYDSDAETNVVWVYISSLRKKLHLLDAQVQIRVARNLGYSLEGCE
ncbi:MAG TPA: response regulator transcription factor [Candidatus Onthovicinus excrementipullorum]|nr:response regulator transcription factor [Candidatus Onthovicinus excrementipullorum]